MGGADGPVFRCLIVKTEPYSRQEVAAVVQLRAQVEGLNFAPAVLDRIAGEGEKGSLRFVRQTL